MHHFWSRILLAHDTYKLQNGSHKFQNSQGLLQDDFMTVISVLTMTQLFPPQTELFALYLDRVIMKTNYLMFIQDLPFLWGITSTKKYCY